MFGVYLQIHRYYRTSGMTVRQAQEEFAQSRAVRSAGQAAAETTVAAVTAK